MEIYAAIKALESLREPCHVILHSDSQYLVNAINEGWVTRWKEKNWWRSTQERAANVDLWERLLELCATHQVEWVWVRGHAGHVENERCDYLAMNALKQADLPPDEGYENREANDEGKVKVIQEGQPCRKCSTPVIKRKPQRPKKTQAYYYGYYLYCPKCQTTYMVEEAKRFFDESMSLLQDDGALLGGSDQGGPGEYRTSPVQPSTTMYGSSCPVGRSAPTHDELS